MGCPACIEIDPDIAKILATLDLKMEEYQKVFEKEAKEVKDKQEKQLKERKETLQKLKEKKEEIKEDMIKDLNKKELEVEIGILTNQVDKMHYIFSIGLELAEPIKKITLDKLIEKSKKVPALALNAIKKQIDEVKKIPLIEFLNSTYGKVLREALEKKGMSATILKSFKNQLFKERGQRRKVEREEFGIKVNEFDNEKIDDLKLDLYSLIEAEYKGIDKNFREYARSQMVEAWLGSQ
jgi:ElaB/YqjD/DUF883 family membrane-anchored ribosome-binding protein